MSAAHKTWLVAIGIVLVLEGTPYLVGPGFMKRFLRRVQEVPDASLRAFGILAAAAGFALLGWLRLSP